MHEFNCTISSSGCQMPVVANKSLEFRKLKWQWQQIWQLFMFFSVVIIYQAVMKNIPESVVDQIHGHLTPPSHETFFCHTPYIQTLVLVPLFSHYKDFSRQSELNLTALRKRKQIKSDQVSMSRKVCQNLDRTFVSGRLCCTYVYTHFFYAFDGHLNNFMLSQGCNNAKRTKFVLQVKSLHLHQLMVFKDIVVFQ